MNFDLRVCIEEVVDLVAAQAHLKELELNFLIGDPTPTNLEGDLVRLNQILTILLTNAVKFTQTGEIVVTADLKAETDSTATILFAVSDTGLGFSKSLAHELSVFFAQPDTAIAKGQVPGMDLAVCRSLIKMMAGEIWLDTEEGKGTTFWFAIRFAKQVSIPSTDANQIMPAIDLHGLRLLVVSETDTTRSMIRQQAAPWQISRIDEAINATIAINALSRAAASGNPYDIALLDQKMSALSGEVLGTTIRSEPELNHTKLVIMTFIHQQSIAAGLLEKGFAANLVKPIKPLTLLHALLEAGATLRSTQPPKTQTFDRSLEDADSTKISDIPDHNSAQVLDINHLIRICEGNYEVMTKMLDQFLEDVPTKILMMRQAIEHNDFFSMRQNAHSLKGSSVTIGVNSLEVGARTLEQQASDHDISNSLVVLEGLEAILNQLQQQHSLILQQIEAQVAEQNTTNHEIDRVTNDDRQNRSINILLVDDDRMTLTWLTDSLKNIDNYSLSTALNGESAWNLLSTQAFDIIISDWSMPDMAGIVLCQRLKFCPHLPSAKAIFLLLTAFSNPEYQKIAHDVGVDDFIVKPVNPEDLRAKIDFWTDTRE